MAEVARDVVMIVANMIEASLAGGLADDPAGKITAAHVERSAVLYVRQSTIAQVREHTESTSVNVALHISHHMPSKQRNQMLATTVNLTWRIALESVRNCDGGKS
jgi:hypothetical protein